MSQSPNILFIFTDDQRFDTIAALGNKAIKTPNLDRLVARGTAFTHAHIMGGSSPAVCMPSRAMLHTGRTLFHIERMGQKIDPDHTMLGEHLRTAGYHTWGCGKWHNSAEAFNRAFDDGKSIYFGGMCDHWNVPGHDYNPSGDYSQTTPRSVSPMNSKAVVQGQGSAIKPGVHSSELLADAAIDFLQSDAADQPFFAYVSLLAPHDPRTMPQQFLDMYDPAEVDLPPNFAPAHAFDNGELFVRDEKLAAFPRDEDEIREHIADYYAMITHLDYEMGRVLDALEAGGKAENTIVVFAGDNGLAVGQHGLLGKQNMYDHSVRVPLIFAGPGIPQGQQRDALAGLIDIFPTLCDLVGIDIPDTVEGQSLVPCFQDAAHTPREVMHLAYMDLQRAVTDRHHKLISYHVNGARREQLFDLQADPFECHDLSRDPAHAATRDRLREQLERWRTELDDTRPNFGERFWGD